MFVKFLRLVGLCQCVGLSMYCFTQPAEKSNSMDHVYKNETATVYSLTHTWY